MRDTMAQAVELAESGKRFCLAVVVGKSGSAPQIPGAKGLFLEDGQVIGTIGGGCLEMEARRLGLLAIHTGQPAVHEFRLNDDFGWDDGLICGGRVEVLLAPRPEDYVDAFRQAVRDRARGVLCFDLESGKAMFHADDTQQEHVDGFATALRTKRQVRSEHRYVEPVLPRERLIVFGAGHIGRQIAQQGSLLGFHVTIVDDRPEFVTEERVPFAHERVCEIPQSYAASLETDQDTYVCLVTRGHRNDARCLRELIGKPVAYLGMIGSKRKREVVRQEMIAEGLCSEAQFERVKCPMGLDVGAETVDEIAVSIAAELVQIRASRRGPILARCTPRAVAATSD